MQNRMKRMASLAAAALALSPPASASIYQFVGDGICLPKTGEHYGYLMTSDRLNTASCSEACDSANAGDDGATFHYRGFSHVKRGNGSGRHRGDCYCFYDCHFLPSVTDELIATGDWEMDDPDVIPEGGGPIEGTDGAPYVGCFEVVVEDRVVPNADPDVIWAGYHNYNGGSLRGRN